MCILKDFFFCLIWEETELKQLCLNQNTFLLQLFLILYTPKKIYAFREKKVLKKTHSYLPTPIFFRL